MIFEHDQLKSKVRKTERFIKEIKKDLEQDGKRCEKEKEIEQKVLENKEMMTQVTALFKQAQIQEQSRDRLIARVGNYVHFSVPISCDEKYNKEIRKWGDCHNSSEHHHTHDQLLQMIDGVDIKAGTRLSGHRGYFLKGVVVRSNQALINFGLDFLEENKYIAIQPPAWMHEDIMSKTAQLEQFDEELFKLPPSNYLIATSEQPISALHQNHCFKKHELPIRYAGISSCFRKEAGAAGKDMRGIFRVHQFEKVEQFVLSAPEQSWQLLEEMIQISEAFYKELVIPYRVVSIVSGALNNAASKKYDLEAWFPASKQYRELVSCSNCTDYQARALNIQCESKTAKEYVHLLNATLTATERTLCCILENYQTESGIRIPKVLQPYMKNKDFIPFVSPCPKRKK